LLIEFFEKYFVFFGRNTFFTVIVIEGKNLFQKESTQDNGGAEY